MASATQRAPGLIAFCRNPLPVDQLNPGDGEFIRIKGGEGAAMFGLDPDWPSEA
jgi:hypothetical protein